MNSYRLGTPVSQQPKGEPPMNDDLIQTRMIIRCIITVAAILAATITINNILDDHAKVAQTQAETAEHQAAERQAHEEAMREMWVKMPKAKDPVEHP